ncbi:ABC transporter permease [Paenarthrobacter sp. NPDC090520]|uniref:ABC transporter permease n=1 Tax=Paenarthrobacter sp. NPDC090520 TaxID=3364382 RepID=UPI00380C33F1
MLRNPVQLAAISVILSGVMSNPLSVGAALAVMFIVATLTAARRIAWSPTSVGVACVSMAAGVLDSTAAV